MARIFIIIILLIIPCSGCITIKALSSPRSNFDFIKNDIDKCCIIGDFLLVGPSSAYSTNYNLIITDDSISDEKRVGESFCVGFAFAGLFTLADYALARILVPSHFKNTDKNDEYYPYRIKYD